jgi:hypothetical protein
MPKDPIYPPVIRAWVLVTAPENPQAVAAGIYGLNQTESKERNRGAWRDAYNGVVRAAVVQGDGTEFNVVAAVFARNEDEMGFILEQIGAVSGVSSTARLTMSADPSHHYPDPPHAGPGYITDEEAEKVDPPAGPCDFNAWG